MASKPLSRLGKPLLSLGPLLYHALSSLGQPLLGTCVHADTPASHRAGPGRSPQGHWNVQHLLPFAAQQQTSFKEQKELRPGFLCPAVILALRMLMFAQQRAYPQGRLSLTLKPLTPGTQRAFGLCGIAHLKHTRSGKEG